MYKTLITQYFFEQRSPSVCYIRDMINQCNNKPQSEGFLDSSNFQCSSNLEKDNDIYGNELKDNEHFGDNVGEGLLLKQGKTF